MVHNCAAYGCSNFSRKKNSKIKQISYHRFPLNNPDLLKKWLLLVRRSNFVPKQHSFVCSEHFTDDDYEIVRPSNRRFLKRDAYPTKFNFSPLKTNFFKSELGTKMKTLGIGLKAVIGQKEKQCNKCGFATFSLFVLYKHRHKCNGKLLGQPLICSYCRRKFDFLSLYKKHHSICVKKILRLKFLKKKLESKHLGYKTKGTSFSCPICEASFETKQKFVSHLKKQSCQSPVKRKKSSLSARKSLNSHTHPKLRKYVEQLESSTSFPDEYPVLVHDNELYHCSWCKSYYPSKKFLKLHMQMNDECAKALFKSKPKGKKLSLTARKSTSAVAKKSFSNRKKNSVMEFYSRVRNNRSARKSLQSTRKKPNQLSLWDSSDAELPLTECPVCYRCFPDTYAFFQHQKKMNHWGKATKSFSAALKCPFCAKEFMHIFSRDAHLKNHTEVPNHKIKTFIENHTCSVCSTSFASVLAKMQHERIQHSGRRKYSASASKTLNESNNKMSFVPKSVKKKLKQQPNSCPVCCQAFSHTVLRNKHFNEVHLKIFECQVCNTKFKSTSSLSNHIKLSHTNEFECRGCKVSFEDELNLLQHVLKSHQNRDPKLYLPLKLLNSPSRDSGKNLSNDNSQSSGNMEYYCDVCNIGYLKLCGLQRHRQSKLHKETTEKKLHTFCRSRSFLPPPSASGPQTVKQPEILICSECSEEFNCIKDFVPHRLSHFSVHSKYLRITELNPYMCEICSEVLDSHSKVQLHLFWHLQIESTAVGVTSKSAIKKTAVPDRLSLEPVAKKSFSRQSDDSLQEVVIGGVSKPLFTCENCNVSYTTKEHYSIHIEKLCKKGKFTAKPRTGNQINLERNEIVHCVQCNFLFCNSVKHDRHKPYCLKLNFDNCSEQYICNLRAVKSALVQEMGVAGCVTCGSIFDSPVNKMHLSWHKDEKHNSDTDDVPEDILLCALCNTLLPVSAFKAHREFCTTLLNFKHNSKNVDCLKSALELKSALAGCISCGECFDDLNLFAEHLSLHQNGKININQQGTQYNGGGVSPKRKESKLDAPSRTKLISKKTEFSNKNQVSKPNTLKNFTLTQRSKVAENNSCNINELRENFSQLLCILIADAELMDTLGYGKLSIEDVLVNILKQMGQKPSTDQTLSVSQKFRNNIKILLELCLKDQIMQEIGKDKTADEIVVEALNIFAVE